MKFCNSLLVACLVVFLQSAPAFCQEVLTGLVNSHVDEVPVIIMNKNGVTQEKTIKVTTYEYLNKEGARVELPYKVPGLPDTRRFRVRHPFLYLLAPLVPTLIWEGLRATTPIP